MFGDIGKIMKLFSKLRNELPALQKKLASSEYVATTGNGAVTATVNGRLALVDLKIDRDLLPEGELDSVMIEDLVKAAMAAAQNQAIEAAQKAMMELTDGMDLPPGMENLF